MEYCNFFWSWSHFKRSFAFHGGYTLPLLMCVVNRQPDFCCRAFPSEILPRQKDPLMLKNTCGCHFQMRRFIPPGTVEKSWQNSNCGARCGKKLKIVSCVVVAYCRACLLQSRLTFEHANTEVKIGTQRREDWRQMTTSPFVCYIGVIFQNHVYCKRKTADLDTLLKVTWPFVEDVGLLQGWDKGNNNSLCRSIFHKCHCSHDLTVPANVIHLLQWISLKNNLHIRCVLLCRLSSCSLHETITKNVRGWVM